MRKPISKRKKERKKERKKINAAGKRKNEMKFKGKIINK